jgi:hypothetical protein
MSVVAKPKRPDIPRRGCEDASEEGAEDRGCLAEVGDVAVDVS